MILYLFFFWLFSGQLGRRRAGLAPGQRPPFHVADCAQVRRHLQPVPPVGGQPGLEPPGSPSSTHISLILFLLLWCFHRVAGWTDYESVDALIVSIDGNPIWLRLWRRFIGFRWTDVEMKTNRLVD